MTRRKKDVLDLGEIEVPRFSTGEVAEILDLPIWRVQKFIDVKSYRISPTGQLGRGPGSRRTFSKLDLYRIGIAAFLIRDGFAPWLVADVLESLEDHDIYDLDAFGDAIYGGIALRRGAKEPEVELFRSEHPPKMGNEGLYYVLDLWQVIGKIDRRIKAALEKRRK